MAGMPDMDKLEMNKKTSQLSNPISTGGGGGNFETRVQAAFAVLMLTGGVAPCLSPWPIQKIKLQGKYTGFDMDDLVVFVKHPNGDRKAKLLAQIKRSIRITGNDKTFGEVIQASWNDFQNTDFSVGTDSFALITGPLSATDTNDVRTILERARHSEDAKDFLTQVNLAKFSSKPQRTKLQVFQTHLKNANGGIDVSDKQLWEFMKSFHLIGYDLDIKAGVTLSLLHSLIEQYSPDNSKNLWSRVVDEIQSANQNAGTINLETLSEDIRSTFQRRIVETIPDSFIRKQEITETYAWSGEQYASELAVAVLLGAWDEKNDADRDAVEQLANENFTVWINKIREILLKPGSSLSLKNGNWSVTKRLEMWNMLGPRLFDEHLDKFKEIAVNVLRERDPMFDLPPDERYAASIYGKVLAHSHILRKGLTESLALFGSHPKALSNCSINKRDSTASLAVREVLSDADWVLWASLNNLLPLLAEAAPQKCLDAVEAALRNYTCPFDELFAQEGSGITSGNYMTGLLWALEALAWDEQYLTRVTVILGELASRDPGGNWVNRPANSLTTIFLPWLPQTTAPMKKRLVAVRTLQKELPEIAWKILLSLLPNQFQMSTGTYKPVWRKTILEGWSKGVTQKEYWDQVSSYADMVIEIAQADIDKLVALIEHLETLPQPAFEKLLEHLKSEEITGMPEDNRVLLWTKLVDLVGKHRKFVDAEWALEPDLIEKVDRVAECLAPQSPMNRYQRFFSGRDFNLYEEKGNWKEQRKKLEKHRQEAIREIIENNGLKAVIEFAESVESPWQVGLSLGFIVEERADSIILPELLGTKTGRLAQFASGFVWGRYHGLGWNWVDHNDLSAWTPEQIGQFLVHLPFTPETWKRSRRLLGQNEAAYWKNVSVNPYQVEDDLNPVIDKLLEHGRPSDAISCLAKMLHDKQPVDDSKAVKVLLTAVTTEETVRSMNVYDTIQIIKALQDDPNTNLDELSQVEWTYLPLLDEHHGASPKYLEQCLSSDPEFFCEVIRTVFRSKNAERPVEEPTEQQKTIAMNAYRLLRDWKKTPGSQADGSFDGDAFNHWLNKVKSSCEESGHLDVTPSQIGNVLIHTPPDPDGLWIHHSVAEALNAEDAEDMRNGFRIGILNSRDVHCVDPAGKPEKEFAAKYRQRAEEVEAHGYHRLATTLRELAASYDLEAERIIEEHKIRGANEK